MDHIDEYLATAAQNTDYSLSICAALAIGKKTLNRYYNKTDHSEVYRIAMGKISCTNNNSSTNIFLVLHPRHKLHYFKSAGWNETWIKAARTIVREEFDRTYAFMDVDVETVSADAVSNLLNTSSLWTHYSF